MKPIPSLFFLWSPFLLLACGTEEKKTSVEKSQELSSLATLNSPISIKLDSTFSAANRAKIAADFTGLDRMRISSLSGSAFRLAFGEGSAGVLKYLDERVSVFLPSSANLKQRLIGVAQTRRRNVGSGAMDLGDSGDDGLEVVADNFGALAWILQTASDRKAAFAIDSAPIPINSTRVGLIRLGEAYLNDAYDIDYPLVSRLMVLVHEARHSDCTRGLDLADKERAKAYLVEVETNPKSQLKLKGTCGHPHSICEKGDYKNLLACDSNPWGAYAIGAEFGGQLASSCTSCSTGEKETARIEAADHKLRLNDSAKAAMAANPAPDMSTTDSVVP